MMEVVCGVIHNFIMQYLSEAHFVSVLEPILFFETTYNKIVYITKTHIYSQNLLALSKNQKLPFDGGSVRAFTICTSNYLALLTQSTLQIRHLDNLGEVLWRQSISTAELKVALRGDKLYYIVGMQLYTLNLTKPADRGSLCLDGSIEAKSLLISHIMEQEDIVILQYRSIVKLSIGSNLIASLEPGQIDCMALLRNPLMDVRKEYLVMMVDRRWLQVYNMSNLKQIYQLELSVHKKDEITIHNDPLGEFLLVRLCRKGKGKAHNFLLKVNKNYYYDSDLRLFADDEPFFLYLTQVTMKEKLYLFPAHQELLREKEYECIDMCFVRNNHLMMASLMVESKYVCKVDRSETKRADWTEVAHWKSMILDVMNAQSFVEVQSVEELPTKQEEELWEVFLKQFIKKPNKTEEELERAIAELQASAGLIPYQYTQPNGSKPKDCKPKAILEVEQPLPPRKLELVPREPESEQEDDAWFLTETQHIVVGQFQASSSLLSQLDNRVCRIEDVQLHRLRSINAKVTEHVKECLTIKSAIMSSMQISVMRLFTNLRDRLDRFRAGISERENGQAIQWKKLIKVHKNYLVEEIETSQERMEKRQEVLFKLQGLGRDWLGS